MFHVDVLHPKLPDVCPGH